MTIKTAANKRLMVMLVTLSMVGILLLVRIALVSGISAYMNAESKKEGANSEVIATYYIVQAFTGDFMEPYIAYYNAGTSLAKANQPQEAEQLLTTALAKVDNATNECYVRNNLAKVQEQLGDFAMISGTPNTAEIYYKKAITTVSESPASCFPPPPPSGGNGTGEGQPKPTDPKTDPNGNPLTPQDDTSKDAQNGQNMKDTEQRSKDKEAKAKDAQGKNTDGKDQVKNEMNQTKGETDNQKDLTNQKNNQPESQVTKPW